MVSLRTFRSIPHFADLFAHVPVFCWPILWWQLNILMRYCKRRGIPDVCYSVNDWGFITVRHLVARPDPAAYKLPERTFRPLTDASWGSALPACLDALAAEADRNLLMLPRFSGGLRGSKIASRFSERGSPQRGLTEGALSSTLDTS